MGIVHARIGLVTQRMQIGELYSGDAQGVGESVEGVYERRALRGVQRVTDSSLAEAGRLCEIRLREYRPMFAPRLVQPTAQLVTWSTLSGENLIHHRRQLSGEAFVLVHRTPVNLQQPYTCA